MERFIFKWNNDEKHEFLSRFSGPNRSKATYNKVASILRRIDRHETLYQKPLNDMSVNMIDCLYADIMSVSQVSLQGFHAVVKQYSEFIAYKTKEETQAFAYLQSLNSRYFRHALNQDAIFNSLLTHKQYREVLANESIDPANRALVILLWKGVRGHAYEKIRRITFDRIDYQTGVCYLRGDRGVALFDEEELNIFKQAETKNTFTYIYNSTTNNTDSKIKLISSFYALDADGLHRNQRIIKPYINKRNDGLGELSDMSVKHRVANIGKQIGNEHLTGKSIERSGLCHEMLTHFDFEVPTNKQCQAYVRDKEVSFSKERLKFVLADFAQKMKALGEI